MSNILRCNYYHVTTGLSRDKYFVNSINPTRKCHPHALKHSLATHLISENVNLAWVKQCLGHKAIGSTMKYVAVTDSQAAAGAQAALMRMF
jgi:site-specific recombinase XerD